ncbi:MAG: hypothetical protein ABW167_16120 [Baekduia sp.]
MEQPTKVATSAPKAISAASAAGVSAGRRAGGAACRGASSERTLARYLADARRSKAAETAMVRKSLITRVAAMPASTRRSPAAIPVVAALVAISKPKALRSGAFVGCLSELHKETS